MPRAYTKVEILSEEVFRRKAAGETNREIAESYGLTLKQIKKLITRQNNKAEKIANGYIPRPKGRPRKDTADEEIRRFPLQIHRPRNGYPAVYQKDNEIPFLFLVLRAVPTDEGMLYCFYSAERKAEYIVRLEMLLPYQLRNAIRQELPAFFAFGSIEYHSEHLPLGTDTLIAEGLLKEIEKRVSIVIAPPIPVAPTMHWAGSPSDGDMDFASCPLLAYVREYLRGLLELGFKKIYVMLGHQGQDGDPGTIVKRACWDLAEQQAQSFGYGWGQHPEQISGANGIFSRVETATYDQHCDYTGRVEHLPVGHAGRGETQLVQALCPKAVELHRLEQVQRPWPAWLEDVGLASEKEGREWLAFCADAWAAYLSQTNAHGE